MSNFVVPILLFGSQKLFLMPTSIPPVAIKVSPQVAYANANPNDGKLFQTPIIQLTSHDMFGYTPQAISSALIGGVVGLVVASKYDKSKLLGVVIGIVSGYMAFKLSVYTGFAGQPNISPKIK